MKEKIALLLVAVLLSSGLGGFAEVEKNLTLKEFVSLYTANNEEVIAINQEISIAEAQLLDIETRNKTLKKEHKSVDDYMRLTLSLEYEPKAKALEIEQLKRRKTHLEQRLKVEAQRAFVEFQVLQTELFTQRQRLVKSQSEYQVKRELVERGALAQAALKGYAIAVGLEEEAYLKAELAYTLKKMSINGEIGKALEAELLLTGIVNLNIMAVEAFDIETLDSVKQARETLKMATLKRDLYSARIWRNGMDRSELVPYYELPSDWTAVKKAVVDAELALSKVLKSEASKVRMAYNRVKSGEIDIRVTQLKIEKAEMDHAAAKVRFDIGHIDAVQWRESEYQLALEKRALLKAHQNLYFAYLDYLLTTSGTF